VRVAAIDGERRLRIGERPVPVPGPGEVRIDVGFCGICGTDLHMLDALPVDTVLGHEVAGTVGALGEGVEGWALGDEAAVLIYRNCGKCRYCLAGQENQCVEGGQHSNVIGVDIQGGYAESLIAHVSALYPIPDGIGPREACLAEPVSIGLRAAGAVDVPTADPVLVIGAGPIGLFAAFALRDRGYENLFVVERNPVRAGVAAKLGFETLESDDLPARLAERGLPAPGAVVECAAAPPAARAAAEALRRQGTLVLVGLPEGDVAFDAQSLVVNEIRVQGAAGTSRADFVAALDLIARGAIPVDEVITACVDLGEADAMVTQLRDPKTEHVKVLLAP
jgi:threonine dehydrogenase-like Zn-dependent dehydrogenase